MMSFSARQSLRHSRSLPRGFQIQGGAVLVELTMILALFMVPILLCLVEAGRLIYTYKVLVHQVHHTARYLSVQSPGSNLDQAVCLFKTGQVPCSGSVLLLPGFNDNFKLTIEESTGSMNQVGVRVVTVTANAYAHSFVFSDLFGAPSMSFRPISASFRQVN